METSWVMSPAEVVGSSHHYEREGKRGEKIAFLVGPQKTSITFGI